jgi:S1-C subfamily serine protease
MRIPDWLIYLAVIGAIVWVLFRLDDPADEAPPSMPGSEAIGAVLPPASVFDPEVLVEVGPQQSGVGTAFAIDESGWWLTARHVVADCKDVGIIVGRRAAARVKIVRPAPFADIALLKTERAPEALALDTAEDKLRIGQLAYHVGFPQGRQGEAVSRLYRREKLVAHGRYTNEEPVLAWAELGRTHGLSGSLAGMSGGPVFDGQGNVIGITIAESARRGRIYTASPASIARLLGLANLEPVGEPAPPMNRTNYGPKSDQLRRSLAVAQVVCVAEDPSLADDGG